MAGGTVAGKLVLIPSNPGGACSAINVVTTEPEVAALRNILRIAEAVHQHGPGAGRACRCPSRSRSALPKARSPVSME